MPAPSAAQRLPEHIVEDIAHYISGTPPRPVSRDAHMAPALPQKRFLLPLMHTCRAWRRAACLLFFRVAQCRVPGDESVYGIRKRVTVRDAADSGCGDCVAQVHMEVSIGEFFRPRKERDAMCAPASAVRAHGQMPSVRSLEMRFRLSGSDEMSRLSALASSDPDARLAGGNFDALIDAVLHVAPNIRRVAIHTVTIGRRDAVLEECLWHMFRGTARLGQACIDRLELSHVGYNNNPVGLPPPGALKCIVFDSGAVLREHVELVRRSSETLEELRLPGIHENLVPIWLGGDTGEWHVYPRLKHLRLVFYTPPPGKAALQGPQTNPFPRLETLVCLESAPFSIPVVILDVRARIRHLKVRMDAAVEDALRQATARSDCYAFPSLVYISLFSGQDGPPLPSPVPSALSWVSRIGPSLRTAQFGNLCAGRVNYDSVCHGTLDTLQTLDIYGSPLTVAQAASILCACPRLLKAQVSLEYVPEEPGKSTPPSAEIKRLQRKHREDSPGVRLLGLEMLQHWSARPMGGAIVLLADLVPSVSRVSASISPHVSEADLMAHIASARRRSPYNGRTHLDRVQFSVGHDC
ncbi:hypothetical protein H4R18_003614 [Coemansia javaensis]|uniref:Uncharacterized protein n=1 Tax=Coemansia javaensis TaxID=2761396 RepID=A0A9W8H8L2_9FUNG|nr:hypothetical protein H4R18_003614 [Coemansia javaensis]